MTGLTWWESWSVISETWSLEIGGITYADRPESLADFRLLLLLCLRLVAGIKVKDVLLLLLFLLFLVASLRTVLGDGRLEEIGLRLVEGADPIVPFDVSEDVWVSCEQDDLTVHVVMRVAAFPHHSMEDLITHRKKNLLTILLSTST